MVHEEPIDRTSCRVVLLNAANHILLLEHIASASADFASIWVPPGGAIEAGESAEDAALRELWEETGLRLTGVGPLVWIRRATIRFPDSRLYRCVEQFYVGRTPAYDPGSHLNIDEAERASVLGYKWWSLEEIESSREVFAPRRLAELLQPLLLGEYPTTPIEVDDFVGE